MNTVQEIRVVSAAFGDLQGKQLQLYGVMQDSQMVVEKHTFRLRDLKQALMRGEPKYQEWYDCAMVVATATRKYDSAEKEYNFMTKMVEDSRNELNTLQECLEHELDAVFTQLYNNYNDMMDHPE
jgi:hypothetical protein